MDQKPKLQNIDQIYGGKDGLFQESVRLKTAHLQQVAKNERRRIGQRRGVPRRVLEPA